MQRVRTRVAGYVLESGVILCEWGSPLCSTLMAASSDVRRQPLGLRCRCSGVHTAEEGAALCPLPAAEQQRSSLVPLQLEVDREDLKLSRSAQ